VFAMACSTVAHMSSARSDCLRAVGFKTTRTRGMPWPRGCQTASVQSTEMAERVDAAVGFRDLGRILEYVPRAARSSERKL
jgi:hypothetical protein